MKKEISTIFLTLFLVGCNSTEPRASSTNSSSPISTPTQVSYPIDNFTTNITKKPFGIYITPKNSPVQPEKFTGYHTGVDIEAGDQDSDTPIYAIADGKIILKKIATGYGGVLVVEHKIDSKIYSAIYGHLRLSSITKNIGDEVRAGEQIAVLGTAYSQEASGERKHLHFGLMEGSSTSILGYVQTKSALSGWLDPQKFFKNSID